MSHLIRSVTSTAAMLILVACLSPTALGSTALGGIPWHESLDKAREAAAISKRPVLAVFGAAWSQASVSLYEKTLVDSEVVAILTACFEPVRIDVDENPAITRRFGVTYLPSACVTDADDRVLTKFDCPAAPASFIAAAGRAVQAAASTAAQPAVTAVATTPSPATSAFPAAEETKTIPDTAPAAATSAFVSSSSNASHGVSVAPWQPDPASERLPGEMPSAPWAAKPSAAPAAPPTPATTSTAARPVIAPAPSAPATSPPGAASWLATPATPAAPAISATAAPPTQPAQGTAVTYGSTPPPATAVLPPAAPVQPSPPEKPKPTNSFIAAMQNPFSMFSKQPKADDKPDVLPPPIPKAGTADPYGSMPLGMEGFCPVTLVEKGAWVEGRAQWGVRHRGRTYLFAGESQQRAFLADPDRYAPALSGDDPVLAFDSGKSVPGQRRFGVTYESRIYLFSTPETRTAFSADPQRYTARVAVAENRGPVTGSVVR